MKPNIFDNANVSDTSFGWNGYNEGFTIYYPHFTDLIPGQHRSFSLSSGLTPIIEFQNVERTLLGAPHTLCKNTSASNSYNNRNFAYYRENLCEFQGNYCGKDIFSKLNVSTCRTAGGY